MEIIGLLVAIGCIYWCYSLAKKQGRNTVLGALLGFLFGIFAVIGYYIAGDKK